jgi:hypothetical protein
MLDLRVLCHKDHSLEVSWGGDCSEWLGRGCKQVGTTPGVSFRAILGSDGDIGIKIAL